MPVPNWESAGSWARPGGNLEPSHLKPAHLKPSQGASGLSLLFAMGTRPTASDIERQLASASESGQGARISHRPPDDHGRLELLAGGLTYDVGGLAPGSAAPLPSVDQVFGVPPDIARFEFEPISLKPGAHVASGGALLPVVRVMLGLAANLALELPVTALCWNPAGIWMEPKYFNRIVLAWLSGGLFPALGLTRLCAGPDGVVESGGLAFFIGQELSVNASAGEQEPETVRLAVRIVDFLVRRGPLDRPASFPGPMGEALLLEPSPDGGRIVVGRQA